MNSDTRKIRNITVVGLILNVFLTFSKALGGLLFHSQALLADAIHSMSDLVTDVAVYVGVKYWRAPPDVSHPYGHGRIETCISAAIGFILAGVAVELCADAIDVVRSGKYIAPELPAFWIALFSVVSKEILYRATMQVSKESFSSALEANAKHHRSDAISSIPVAAAVVVSNLFPQLKYVDQAGTFIVSIFIMQSAWEIVKPAIDELCDTADFQVQENISKIIAGYPHVCAVRSIRTRKIGGYTTGDMSIFVDPDITVREGAHISHKLKTDILSANENMIDIVIYVEPFDEDK